MGQTPSVSVVITTYNQASYIGPALDSVFAQSRPPAEVIVVDDGSTDETSERIAPYRDRLVYIRQPNQGVAQARNTGVRTARGDLLAFLDGDDLWESEKLALQVAAACAYPDSGLIAVNGVQFSETRLTRESLFPSPIARLFDGGVDSVCVDASPYFLRACVVSTTSQAMIPARMLEATVSVPVTTSDDNVREYRRHAVRAGDPFEFDTATYIIYGNIVEVQAPHGATSAAPGASVK